MLPSAVTRSDKSWLAVLREHFTATRDPRDRRCERQKAQRPRARWARDRRARVEASPERVLSGRARPISYITSVFERLRRRRAASLAFLRRLTDGFM